MLRAERPCPRHFRTRSKVWLSVESLESRWCPAVPAFSSLPGANQTIYLDFDGHDTQNTQWNSYFNTSVIRSPAYDTDGNPASFSAAEIAQIEEAWQRISEDYAPFNVNVTTVDPGVEALRKSGGGDTQWGIRVIVTRDTQGTGAGGIGYIDSFNWSTDTGVFVYVTGGKNVAEAASHEVGHSLGLAHDGTSTAGYYTGHGSGETSWAPLMGVGYYTNVTQWDRGEYYNTNNGGASANYNKGPNDLAIITTYNGFGYRADDYGDTQASAAPLTLSGNSLSGSGLISTTSDADYFSFTTGAGLVTLNINPFTPGPNLDVRADLYNAAGNLVATSSDPGVLSAGFSLNLAAGQYFLRVDGTGFGAPGSNPPSGYSDFATLGRYFITGTVASVGTQLPQLSISDVTVNEGSGTATFSVSISGVLSGNVSVNYATADGSATAPSDYQSTAGTLNFTPGGPTTQTFTVNIVDDATTESPENFFVRLSSASGATLGDAEGQATINDNDVNPSLNLAATNADQREGSGGGTTPFTFTVTRLGGTAGSASVDWSVSGVGGGKSAATANDFAGNAYPSGTVTFAPGETSKDITIYVNADNSKEQNERFRVTLSNAQGSTLGTSTADGTIANDDGPKASGIITPHKMPLPGGSLADDDHSESSNQGQVNRWAQVLQTIVSGNATRATRIASDLAGLDSARSLVNLPSLHLQGVQALSFAAVPPRATGSDAVSKTAQGDSKLNASGSLARQLVSSANLAQQTHLADQWFMDLAAKTA